MRGTTWSMRSHIALLVTLLACATEKKPAPAPKPEPVPTLLDALPDGAGGGAHKVDGDVASGEALAEFLGETGSGLLACGAVGAARARYMPDAGSETPIVALLLEFPDADHARCAFDLERPEKPSLLRPGMSDADERPVKTPLGLRTLEVAVKGRHVLRVFPPADGTALMQTRKLTYVLWQALPAGDAPSLGSLLPKEYRMPDSVRVVTAEQTQIPGAEGLVLRASYECAEDHVATAYAIRLADEDSATMMRDAFQARSAQEKKSPGLFSLGSVQAVSAVDSATLRETILMQKGNVIILLTNIIRRSACAPALQALAHVDAPPPKKLPPPDVDAGTVGSPGTELEFAL